MTTVNANSTAKEIRAALAEVGFIAKPNMKLAKLIEQAKNYEIWEKISRSAVPEKYKAMYGKDQNCGDEIAALLKDNDVAHVASVNGIDLDRWAGKNIGMIRMNLGNVLRGRIRRGDYVNVGGQEFNLDKKAA